MSISPIITIPKLTVVKSWSKTLTTCPSTKNATVWVAPTLMLNSIRLELTCTNSRCARISLYFQDQCNLMKALIITTWLLKNNYGMKQGVLKRKPSYRYQVKLRTQLTRTRRGCSITLMVARVTSTAKRALVSKPDARVITRTQQPLWAELTENKSVHLPL